jgi:hypothetical protein
LWIANLLCLPSRGNILVVAPFHSTFVVLQGALRRADWPTPHLDQLLALGSERP